MRRLLVALLLFAATPALAQSFSGPAVIAQPTTANHCVKIVIGNQITDAGAACGTGDATLAGNNVWTGTVKMTTLPTADPHSAGQLWNNAGVLTVSAG